MPSTGGRILSHIQQDALRHDWDGLIAGTDGSVDELTERMGAGYAVGADPEPIMTFHARVGGPLATPHIRGLPSCLGHPEKVGTRRLPSGTKRDSTLFCHPTAESPLLEELRQWCGTITLVKVKSHTGCLMNERADEKQS